MNSVPAIVVNDEVFVSVSVLLDSEAGQLVGARVGVGVPYAPGSDILDYFFFRRAGAVTKLREI